MNEPQLSDVVEKIVSRIKCNNCGEKTGFTADDFTEDKDLNDIYCSEECRYESETGKPGEEY